MKRVITGMMVMFVVMMGSTWVFANPALLPAHPGYPMSAAKDPVRGQPVANDPGQAPPSVEESRRQASSFHDAHATNPQKEVRPNIVYDNKEDATQG